MRKLLAALAATAALAVAGGAAPASYHDAGTPQAGQSTTRSYHDA